MVKELRAKVIKELRAKVMQKQCKYCGKLFETTSNRREYCDGPHYKVCPVCGEQYLVKHHRYLSRPAVACSYACRAVKRKQTSLQRYHVENPMNTCEARDRAKQTLQDNYDVEFPMQCEELKLKAQQTLLERYGVDNIQKLPEISEKSHDSAKQNWLEKVHQLLPIKLQAKEELPHFIIDDSNMAIYVLTEKASTAFLSQYGFNMIHKFRKIHMSVGLVDDGILYQVLRFEKLPKSDLIILSDFGIRDGYFNPNYYSKLLKFVVEMKGLDQFSAFIPRNVATKQVIDSLSLQFISQGEYEVYWCIKNNDNECDSTSELRKLTRRDNIEKMLCEYDYVTSDYIDEYVFTSS